MLSDSFTFLCTNGFVCVLYCVLLICNAICYWCLSCAASKTHREELDFMLFVLEVSQCFTFCRSVVTFCDKFEGAAPEHSCIITWIAFLLLWIQLFEYPLPPDLLGVDTIINYSAEPSPFDIWSGLSWPINFIGMVHFPVRSLGLFWWLYSSAMCITIYKNQKLPIVLFL